MEEFDEVEVEVEKLMEVRGASGSWGMVHSHGQGPCWRAPP